MTTEIKSLKSMNCWDVSDPPKNVKILHSKYVLKDIRDANGNICNYKARFVLCRSMELNNDEASSLVMNLTNVKLLLSLATQNQWQIRHLDFQNAFPNCKLDRPMYLHLPRYVNK